MRRSVLCGLAVIAFIVSTGCAQAQLIRVGRVPLNDAATAQKVCPALCARTHDFHHNYEWQGRWEHNECHCAIKH